MVSRATTSHVYHKRRGFTIVVVVMFMITVLMLLQWNAAPLEQPSLAAMISEVPLAVALRQEDTVAAAAHPAFDVVGSAVVPSRRFPSLAVSSKVETRVPPLVRLAKRHPMKHFPHGSKPWTTTPNTPNRSIIEDAYRGEYGWRFKEYISSKLEDDFYADVTPYINDMHWFVLDRKYQHRVVKLLNISKHRVALDENLVENVTAHRLLQQCDRDDAEFLFESQSVTFAQLSKKFAATAKSSCFGKQPSTSRVDNDDVDDDPEALSEYLSRFVYEFVCLGDPCDATSFPTESGWVLGETHTSFIEPLFATMRHPMFFLTQGGPSFVENKEYMMVDKWALQNLHTRWKSRWLLQRSRRHHYHQSSHVHRNPVPEQKSIFVDMGASTYVHGRGGASQKWFVGLTDCLCVPFTDMYLFESEIHQPPLVWSSTPGHLHPNYYWYNYPLEVSPSSWRNPLNHLLHKLHPDDVVTVKIDFDSPFLETMLLQTILDVPELYQTIDELFYEYHVRMAYMSRYWPTLDPRVTVKDSIDLFRALRRRGIRAHSWV